MSDGTPEKRSKEETTDPIHLTPLGVHRDCGGEVIFEHTTNQRLCLVCDIPNPELAVEDPMDFVITVEV